MALTNAAARWRERNVIKLSDRAVDIARMLIEMDDQAKLRKIAKFINDHLKHPDRTPEQRAIALGMAGMDGLIGPLSKTAALGARAVPPDHSYRVEAVTADGQRWGSAARLRTEEEAQVYADEYARHELTGYVTSDIIRCDGEPPLNAIIRNQKGGKASLCFVRGKCGSLTWRPLSELKRLAESRLPAG